MRIAVNFSTQAAGLKTEGQAPIDLFKSHTEPEWLDMALAAGPSYMHLPIHADDPDLAAQPWDMYDQMVERTGTKWINIHLSARIKLFPTPGWLPIRDRWLKSLEWLARRYGAGRIIAENTVFRRGDEDKWRPEATDPEHIAEVLDLSGSGLLLDSAHVRITALGCGIDPLELLKAMPLSRLKDWHVSGGAFDQGRWRDSMAMSQGDWDLAEWLISTIRSGEAPSPDIVSLEYGGIGPVFAERSDPVELARSLARLNRLVEGL